MSAFRSSQQRRVLRDMHAHDAALTQAHWPDGAVYLRRPNGVAMRRVHLRIAKSLAAHGCIAEMVPKVGGHITFWITAAGREAIAE